MGLSLSACCLGEKDSDQPTPETRRKQMAEAAERRQLTNEGRGVKDPEALKRKQQKKEELERKAQSQSYQSGDAGLRWQVS